MTEHIKRGLFIAIEGGDGSGKKTQTELLHQHIISDLGLNALKFSFPRYGEDSAYYVEQYLNGAYGEDPNDIPADLASLAFAIDRFKGTKDLQTYLDDDDGIGLTDRYVASNLAHQGAKILNAVKRKVFYERTMITEYDVLGIPKPDINFVLLVPTKIAQENVDKKDTRSYTEKKRDIHEADTDHLDRAKANYEELCRLYPDEYVAITCDDGNGAMLPIDDIQQKLQSFIKPHLI